MKTALLKNLTDQQKDEMRQTFAHAAFLRSQLTTLLNEKINASNKIVRSKDAYGIANWAYLQADAVGYERALQEVISLLSHDQDTPEIVPPAAKRRGRPPGSKNTTKIN